MIIFVGMLLEKLSALALRFRNRYLINKMASAGKNVHIDGRVSICASKMRCGDNVFIGGGAFFVSSDAEICIGDNVMFGPNVMIATGNHRIDVVGKYMIDVKEKREQDDKDVVIEDDVWIGMGVTILKGVTIGKGSVIGAGTIVTRDVPPYSVVYMNSHMKIKPRFTEEELQVHEKLLNGEN